VGVDHAITASFPNAPQSTRSSVPHQNDPVQVGATAVGTRISLLALMSLRGKPCFSLLLGAAVARMLLSGVYEVGHAHE
jgi:hypothetical protein